jgi:hypothetical protein
MTDAAKPALRLSARHVVQGGRYTFIVEDVLISSGPCHTHQEAINAVFREIRSWAQSLTPDIRALVGAEVVATPAPIPSQHPRLEYVREIKPGAGAPILQRLVQQYGQKSNSELAEAIGFINEHKIDSSTFSNALAGRGSRFARCAIAMALKEQPSMLWPSLSLKVRIADDEAYFGALHNLSV